MLKMIIRYYKDVKEKNDKDDDNYNNDDIYCENHDNKTI